MSDRGNPDRRNAPRGTCEQLNTEFTNAPPPHWRGELIPNRETRRAKMENANLEITYVTGDTIQPHPQNPREGDVGAISQSIEHNGVYRPVIVQKSTGYILAGNHTYKAMQALGINRIPTVQIDCDDQQAKRIMLADNRTADLGTYDDTILLDLLQEVDILEGTGYDGDNIDDLIKITENAALSLEDLEAQYGEFSDQDLTRNIIIPAPPQLQDQWRAHADKHKTPAQALQALLT